MGDGRDTVILMIDVTAQRDSQPLDSTRLTAKFDHAVDLPFGRWGLSIHPSPKRKDRKMKDFFRWSPVTKAWDFTKPYLIGMACDMAVDLADRVRKVAR